MQPIITSRPGANMERIDLRSGRRQDLFLPSFRISLAGTACRGVHVLAGRAEPGELAEGFLPNHALVVNLGGPTVYETWWPGRVWKTAAVPRHAVHLFPAGMPYAARWGQPVEALTIAVSQQGYAFGQVRPRFERDEATASREDFRKEIDRFKRGVALLKDAAFPLVGGKLARIIREHRSRTVRDRMLKKAHQR